MDGGGGVPRPSTLRRPGTDGPIRRRGKEEEVDIGPKEPNLEPLPVKLRSQSEIPFPMEYCEFDCPTKVVFDDLRYVLLTHPVHSWLPDIRPEVWLTLTKRLP